MHGIDAACVFLRVHYLLSKKRRPHSLAGRIDVFYDEDHAPWFSARRIRELSTRHFDAHRFPPPVCTVEHHLGELCLLSQAGFHRCLQLLDWKSDVEVKEVLTKNLVGAEP